MSTKKVTKTYFSASANLVLNVNIGKQAIGEGGVLKTVGQKIAEFTSVDGGKFGRLITDDPEKIKFLDERMERGNTDVFDENEFVRRSTPIEKRAEILASENGRLVTDNNRLIAVLREKGIEIPLGQ